MNSLPFISHHLFVAAIGDDDRGREKLAPHESQFAAPSDQASPITLEVMDARKPMPEGSAGTSRVRIAHAVT
jgi:hypothetical protein